MNFFSFVLSKIDIWSFVEILPWLDPAGSPRRLQLPVHHWQWWWCPSLFILPPPAEDAGEDLLFRLHRIRDRVQGVSAPWWSSYVRGAGLALALSDDTDEVEGRRGFTRDAIHGQKQRWREDLMPVQLLHCYRPANRLFGNRTLWSLFSQWPVYCLLSCCCCCKIGQIKRY